MRVLVTGHKGYIGAVLVPMLQQQGHEVVGMDTDLFSRCIFVDEVVDIPNVRLDIRDAELSDFEGIDAVIHLAALSNDPLGDYRPALTKEINEKASVRLAELAKRSGVERFLFASSCSTYGASGGNKFMIETAPFNPVTPYGISKVKVEGALNELADDSFSPTYIRASTAYGVSPKLRFDIVVNNLTAWAFTKGLVYLKSDGTPWRPQVHVEDICRAYIAALQAPQELVHNEAFNIGLTTENYQIREIAELVKEIVPESEVTFAAEAGPDPRCYRVDCNKLAKTLHGFKPQWTVRRGIQQLYDSYKKVGLTLEQFEGPEFMRIAHVKKLISDGILTEDMRWRS
jgi:nucleoside-diphosphate-sugar epimerase